MKTCVIFILSFIVFQSCSFPHYIMENKVQTTGLDFTQGKWLINDIDCPGNVYKTLIERSSKDFGNYLNDRLFPVYDVKGLILPQKLSLNPNKNILNEIKKGCVGFDYFINIRAGKLKEDIGGLDLTPSNYNNKSRSNQSEVWIEVYDLNLLEIIYSQKAIGITTVAENDSQDVHLSKTSRGLLLGAYTKIMNDIDKKSRK